MYYTTNSDRWGRGGGGVGHFVVFSDCVIFAMTFFYEKCLPSLKEEC